MKSISHMNILERAEFTDKIANAIMSANKKLKEVVPLMKQLRL